MHKLRMTNDFKYRFTNCKSCRYNCDDGVECIDCDTCSNCKVISDSKGEPKRCYSQ